jgi:transcriptional regulator with XRE-family HTH domain
MKRLKTLVDKALKRNKFTLGELAYQTNCKYETLRNIRRGKKKKVEPELLLGLYAAAGEDVDNLFREFIRTYNKYLTQVKVYRFIRENADLFYGGNRD